MASRDGNRRPPGSSGRGSASGSGRKAPRKKAAAKSASRKRAASSRTRSKRTPARRRRGPRGRRPAWFRLGSRLLILIAFGAGILASGWILSLDRIVVSRFEGRRFSVPTKVLSAPTILYPGLDARRIDLAGTLQRLGYREQSVQGGRPLRAGLYRWEGSRLRVHLHAFEHPSRAEPARDIVIRLDDGVIDEIRELPRAREVGAVLLEPELVGAYYGVDREQRELVRLSEVPFHLTDAILAVEDRRFETHHGVDFARIGGALVANLRAGGVRQGASTLTQQLVKNFFLTPERTLRRKAQEAVMALLVEARYDKPAILQAYLNEIYLGQRGSTAIHGVGEASHFFFGKSAHELTLAESATLAAIIQSPNRLSPHRNPQRAVERRNLVLELMRKQGRIDLASFEKARAEKLHVAPITVERGESRYFLDALRRQLPEVYDQSVLEVEGLRIYSTLEPRLQRAATKALREGIESIEARRPELRSDDPALRLQGCLLAMRPQTGEILALVGGRSYGDSQFDRCTQARRPAGSAFKPFVYVAALEPRGGTPTITLASILDDTPLEVQTRQGLWKPANYDHKFRGPVPVREALERSLNVPSARLAMDVGIERVADMARRLGITSHLPMVHSLALGTADVAPVEIARAYATLANGGIRPVPHTFEDVVSQGQTLERRTLEFERVLDPGTAFLSVSLLEGVVERGTARSLRDMGFRGPIAGKTGTTDEERDLWFVGFTPELVAVVWLGFDEPRSIGVSSSAGPLPIWASFARSAFGTHARGAFLPPPEIEQMEIEPQTGALALSGCRDHRPEYFLEGTEPSETCPRGRSVGESGGGRRRGVLRWLGDLL